MLTFLSVIRHTYGPIRLSFALVRSAPTHRHLHTHPTITSSPTTALYQRDETLRKHDTKVLSVQPISALSDADRALFKNASEDAHVVVTTETIFYAQGGGQPSDSGTMSSDGGASFEVSSVRNASGGRILHLGKFAIPDSIFSENESVVHQAIDGVKRDLNSRIHTAGHIVGLAVRHLSESILPGGVTELKAQHYPDTAFVDFQGLIDGKHKEAIEIKANDFVRRALPVKVYWWNADELKEKCAVVPTNVVIPEGELVRAVDIEGAGAYPCGGTHVPDTSIVGKVQIKKISRQKGNSKVSYIII